MKVQPNQIYCDDSESFLHYLPDNSVDLVFTSPPYNFGMEYEGSNDSQDWDRYFWKLEKVLTHCARVLKPGGRIAINIQPLFSEYIPSHHIISKMLQDMGLLWRNEILWEKNHYNCKYTAWGSWKSPSSPYMKYTWEFIEVFSKENRKMDGDPENADMDGDDFKKWVYAKWSIAPERKMKEYGHPAMFPEELAKRVIQMFSFKGGMVLDPFCGLGTACMVANRLEREYIGIDISKEYCDNAKARIARENRLI